MTNTLGFFLKKKKEKKNLRKVRNMNEKNGGKKRQKTPTYMRDISF